MKKWQVLVVAILVLLILVSGYFFYLNQTISPSNNDFTSLDISCEADSDCKQACPFGCININQEYAENPEIFCEQIICKCIENECISNTG